MCQTPLVCEPILRTQTSVPLTKATKKKPDGGLSEVAYSQPTPFPSLRVHSKHEGTNMKCKPNWPFKQNQTGELLWRDTGGIHWRIPASRSGSILGRIHRQGILRDIRRDPQATLGYSAGYSAGSTARLLWWDTRRDPLAS